MTAHNKKELHHLWLHEQAAAACVQGRISAEEKAAIIKKYPAAFYTPNKIMRFGLFLLANFAISSAIGLSQMVLPSDKNENIISILLIVWGCIFIAIQEYNIRKHAHFRSGVDDALEWYIAGSLGIGILSLFKLSVSANAFVIGIITLLVALRYINALLAVLSLLAFSVSFYFEYTERLSFGIATIAYAFLIIFAAIVFLTVRSLSNFKTRFYTQCLEFLQATSLVAFYICGNFFVQFELMAELRNEPDEQAPVSTGWLFWILTYATPVIYTALGIIYKKGLFLRTGILLLIPAYMTYRFYFHYFPLEWEIFWLGLILFVAAYFLIRFLKGDRSGYTSRQIKESAGLKELQAMVLADTIAGNTPPHPITGGGSTGGGGATGNY